MATNIIGVTMPTPASDPGISPYPTRHAMNSSENSNEISFSVWIPAAVFSVPVNFRIIPE